MFSKKIIFPFLLIIPIFIISCTVYAGQKHSEQTKTATVTNTEIPSILTKIPSVVETPTLTPVSYDKWALVESLFQRDKNCRVPCFWGIVPGITTWNEAKEFLSKYDAEFRDNGSTPNNGSIIGVQFSYMKAGSKIVYPQDQVYRVDNRGIIESIGLGVPDYDALHSFTSFIQSYGKPDSIWIYTFNESYAGGLPFRIAFFYQREGILIFLIPNELTWNENQITACFRKPYETTIYMWDINKEKSFDLASKDYMNSKKYLALEKATNTNVDSLWSFVSDPNDPLCVVTPKSLWPSQ